MLFQVKFNIREQREAKLYANDVSYITYLKRTSIQQIVKEILILMNQ